LQRLVQAPNGAAVDRVFQDDRSHAKTESDASHDRPWPKDELPFDHRRDHRLFALKQQLIRFAVVAIRQRDDGQVGGFAALEAPDTVVGS
jgi:hypothetical protein